MNSTVYNVRQQCVYTTIHYGTSLSVLGLYENSLRRLVHNVNILVSKGT